MGSPEVTVHFRGRFLELASVRTDWGTDWEFVRRTNCSRAVVIMGLTDEREVPLVHQPRPPVDAWVWELPAGLCDVPDESLEDTARRELREETGYEAERIIPVMSCPAACASASLILDFVLATGLRRVGPPDGDEEHEISVELVPWEELSGFLYARMREGELVDMRIWGVAKLVEDHLAEHLPRR